MPLQLRALIALVESDMNDAILGCRFGELSRKRKKKAGSCLTIVV